MLPAYPSLPTLQLGAFALTVPTYVTWLAVKGFTDEEIARVIGWTAKRVAAIRAHYVDEARVVVSMVERMTA
jgi:hypothetical protein